MTREKIDLMLEMYEHQRLGQMYLDQATFVDKLGNGNLAGYYIGKAERHAEAYVCIRDRLNKEFHTFIRS